MDDFDPLNTNAKQIPPVPKRSPTVLPQGPSSVPLRAVSQGHPPAFSNPVYPYFAPLKRTQPVSQAPNNTNKFDDDVELLRKYGLDNFSLIDSKGKTTPSNDKSPNPFAMGNGNRHSNCTSDPFQNNGANALKANGDVRLKTNNNWTTFDWTCPANQWPMNMQIKDKLYYSKENY